MPKCKAEYTQYYDDAYQKLPAEVRKKAVTLLCVLESLGVGMGTPYTSDIKNAKISMRELIVPFGKDDWRILYKFDPRRNPVLLLIGNKTGNEKNWYKENIPIAEQVYAEYLEDLYIEFPELSKAKQSKKN